MTRLTELEIYIEYWQVNLFKVQNYVKMILESILVN